MLDKIYLTFGGAFFMAKYSFEDKWNAVRLVVEEQISEREAARITGIAKTPIRRWVERYKQFGTEGLLLKHGSYSGEFKISVVEYMHENHLSLTQTAVKFGIPTEITVSKWERIYYEEGPLALYRENRGKKSKMSSNKPRKKKLSKETEEDLIAEVQRLRMENEYLKKLNALVQERIAREKGNELPSSKN